jgi:hypothetical protein
MTIYRHCNDYEPSIGLMQGHFDENEAPELDQDCFDAHDFNVDMEINCRD